MEEKETGLNERELEEILEMARDAAEKARFDGRGNHRKFKKMARKSETIAASKIRVAEVTEPIFMGIVGGSIETIN
ncbi:MAG UNVERIFIED_CONTAM: hypothetical protein LVR29_09410 [Microcystis novacekii LVE1205-3]|jgi:hypothetical protein